MRYPQVVPLILAPVLALGFAFIGRTQEKSQALHIPAPDTNAASGVEMYRAYCAVCHGLDGKGAGPAAAALKVAPGDLTLLAKRNGGKFPDFKVSNVIRGDGSVAAHGSREMPMWGDVFRELKRDESVVALRVHNLTQYLAPLQQK